VERNENLLINNRNRKEIKGRNFLYMPLIYEGNLRQNHVITVITMFKNIMYVTLKNMGRSYIMVLLIELSQHSQNSH